MFAFNKTRFIEEFEKCAETDDHVPPGQVATCMIRAYGCLGSSFHTYNLTSAIAKDLSNGTFDDNPVLLAVGPFTILWVTYGVVKKVHPQEDCTRLLEELNKSWEKFLYL